MTMMRNPSHKFYIQSLNRAFAILEAISHESSSGMTLQFHSRSDETAGEHRVPDFAEPYRLPLCCGKQRREVCARFGNLRLGRIAQNSHDVLA